MGRSFPEFPAIKTKLSGKDQAEKEIKQILIRQGKFEVWTGVDATGVYLVMELFQRLY